MVIIWGKVKARSGNSLKLLIFEMKLKMLDKKNGDTLWPNASAEELAEIIKFNMFKPLPRGSIYPQGNKNDTIPYCI